MKKETELDKKNRKKAKSKICETWNKIVPKSSLIKSLPVKSSMGVKLDNIRQMNIFSKRSNQNLLKYYFKLDIVGEKTIFSRIYVIAKE